ncbi:ribonuclease R [uncultured Aquimonas sp.]|uniref:ribonuclease R n=1 Tax=uncultured Aquimonas sp. TaxID=385483 RepID=UPI0008689094|nr:ribonuclease R [uncultured Aquimonas sp.]ODU43780.1 MAG: ribonuclease R [Xanthomonadaceae bacterium SCN 69-123]
MSKRPSKPTPRRGGGSKSQSGAPAGPAKPRGKSAKPAPWLPDLPPAPLPPPPSRKASPDAVLPRPRGRLPQPSVSDPYAEREASKYENPIASREAILQHLEEKGEPVTAEDLAADLQLTAPERFEALGNRLRAMLRDGQLLVNRRGGYAPAKKLDLIAGVVLANADGFGFLRRDGGGDDVFLPPMQMRQVLHGDRVLVSITGLDRRGRPEGAIVEVLERRTQRLVGRFQENDGIASVVPDDRRIHQEILIPPTARGDARSGQIVVCEITQAPSSHRLPMGRVLTTLGEALTASLAVEMAIHDHDIPHVWPQEVLQQAAGVSLEVGAHEIGDRVDLRDLPLVTIDGETARDFDDAVYCETTRNGYRLVVAIADVSHYVRPGTPLDDEAQKRATSVYFPGYVVPMLPETLSNGICSLNPKVDRMCFVCDMRINAEGEVTKSSFYEAVMRSHARLTYTQVWNAVGEQDEGARAQLGGVLPHVENLYALYHVLAAQRQRRGAIEFESTEVEFRLGPAGEVIQAAPQPRNDAHKLIEECMIAANVQAALFLMKKSMPAPYRVHDRPPESKYGELLEFLKGFGLKLPEWSKVTPADYTALLRKIRKRDDCELLETVLLRSQALAVYQPENIGHFGLALEAYAHFTSPIRRYPDLLVHRAIKHALNGGRASTYLYAAHDMAALSLQCSERSRRAEEAEREVDERYRCAFMERHVGAEFDGTIAGVTSFGLFVELDESKISGLVHVTQLPNDYYHFDPAQRLLRGERQGRVHQLGDKVRVLVLRASIEDRKIDFRLVEGGKKSKKVGISK